MANIVEYYSNCEKLCKSCDKLLRIEKREYGKRSGRFYIYVTCYRYYNHMFDGARISCEHHRNKPEWKR